MSSYNSSPNRIIAANGICKNGIYFFPNTYESCYSYVNSGEEFELGIFNEIQVTEDYGNIYFENNPEDDNEIFMVFTMINSADVNTSMVYSIDVRNPDKFKALSFPETRNNAYAIKYFKGSLILFINGGDIFVSNDKCQTWNKIVNFKTTLNIDINSGGNDIL